MKVIAENLSEEEIKGLKQMFNNMDTDRSGTITYEELKVGLSKLGSKLSEAELQQLMEAVSRFASIEISKLVSFIARTTLASPAQVLITESFFFYYQADVDNSGTIDYIEFITATMHRHRLDKEENLHKAFEHFDKDHSGLVFIQIATLLIILITNVFLPTAYDYYNKI